MDDLGAWLVVIVRAVPLVVWLRMRHTLPDVLDIDEAQGEERLRRSLVTDLVLGACLVIFAGGLVGVGLVSSDVAKLLYTAYGAVAAIVGIVLLWQLRERKP